MNAKRRRVSDEELAPQIKPTSAKRRRVTANNNVEKTMEQLRSCQDFIEELKEVKDEEGRMVFENFIRNPTKRSDPEYYKQVKNPIDLTRIQQKLQNEDYAKLDDVFADFELLIDNALSYYQEDSEDYKDALEMRRMYEERKTVMNKSNCNGDTNNRRSARIHEASPASSVKTRSSSPSNDVIDKTVAEDILTTILELTDETKRLLSPPFRLLQTPEEFPLYYEKIKMPIDLKTIAEKTRADCYTTLNGLESDIRLLVKNAKVFNEPGSLIHKDANTILKAFLKKKADVQSGKTPSKSRVEHCKEAVDSLIAQSSTEEEDTYSEDSEEDEELESSTEWGWQLYWAVRNVPSTDDAGSLSDPFVELPSKHYYPDYFDEIKNPMSLFMINRRLKTGRYTSLESLLTHFLQVYANAMEYNLEGSEIYNAAKTLREETIKKALQLKPSIDIEAVQKDVVVPTDSSPSPSVVTTPKWKKVKMKIEEDDGTSDSQSDATPPPSKKQRPRKMRPISTGLTPLPESKPGRKSMDELMLRFRVKLMNFWDLIYDYKEGEYWPAGAFMDLPSKKEWPDYYEVIDNPISLNEIKNRIENNHYDSSVGLMQDLHLLFKNAKTYNERGSELHRDAIRLEKMVSEAHNTNKDAPYESPLVLKEKMGWLKTKLPMYSAKMKGMNSSHSNRVAPSPLSLPPPSNPSDEDSNSSIRSPPPSGSGTAQSTPHYRPKIPVKERMESFNEEGKKMFELLFYLREYKDESGRKIASDFLRLPSKAELPSYYEIIKKPLDFARIQQKLSCKYYRSPIDFVSDIRLMFENACKYNEPESSIYKDAITLQRILLQKKKELFSKPDSNAVCVQMEIKSMLMTIFVSVFNKKDDEGRCYSDSLADLNELFKAKGMDENDFPYSFDQIKKNIDKGRYRRLDRFQGDFFRLFDCARRVSRSDSPLYDDVVQLQLEFVRARDETCKNVLHSQAFNVVHKDVEEIVEKERRRKTSEENEEEKREDAENEPSQVNGTTSHEEEVKSVQMKGIEFRAGDYALISPSEKEVKEAHLMRIERMWKDDGGTTLVRGRWYYRPHETFHLATKKFAPNEVFLTNVRDSITSDRLQCKAAVMHPKQWTKYSPKGFQPEQIFVCEERYLGKQLHFKKIKSWPFPEDDDVIELEERPNALTIVRNPRTINGLKEEDEKSQCSTSTDSTEEDDRCANVVVLDVDRPEIRLSSDEDADGRVYLQQIVTKTGRHYCLGQFVLVFNPHRSLRDIMRIDKLWREKDNREFFSGGLFVRPRDVVHDSSQTFFKKEVFAVVQSDQTRKVEDIQTVCTVLSTKQYAKERPTEVPECDVYVCESRIIGNVEETPEGVTPPDCSLFLNHSLHIDNGIHPFHISTARNVPKFKVYSLSRDIAEEEVFIFRQPIKMDKEASPMLVKGESEDIDMDEAVSETDSNETVGAKELVSWLSHQPKLNAKSKSGYILFSAEIRKRIMHENPEAGFGEVSKIVGVEWKKLTEEQKKQYEVRAEYIANERAKQEAATIATAKQIQPGQMRVYMCKWANCDFQFDSPDGLNEHVVHYHTSQIIVDSENQYVCMWVTCVRNRKEGKPFPSLPRLHRHIKEKHIASSYKIMYGNQRAKNFFKLIVTNGENGSQNAQLVHFPFGMHPSQVANAAPNSLNGGHPPSTPSTVHSMMNGHHEATPRVNGIDSRIPDYTYETRGSPCTVPFQQSAHPQMTPQHHHYTQNMPASTSGHPHNQVPPHPPPSHPHLQQQAQATPSSTPLDARTVININRSLEAVFVPPPSSIQTRRVLHSETYLRYIESLSSSRQRTVSQFDRSLRAHPRNTTSSTNRATANASWIRESRGGQPVREEDVVRALWRLREELVQSTACIERDYSGIL